MDMTKINQVTFTLTRANGETVNVSYQSRSPFNCMFVSNRFSQNIYIGTSKSPYLDNDLIIRLIMDDMYTDHLKVYWAKHIYGTWLGMFTEYDLEHASFPELEYEYGDVDDSSRIEKLQLLTEEIHKVCALSAKERRDYFEPYRIAMQVHIAMEDF